MSQVEIILDAEGIEGQLEELKEKCVIMKERFLILSKYKMSGM